MNKIKELQFFLIGLGLYKGKADGEYGVLTKQAVKDFQKQNGLFVDGIIGSRTLAKAYSLGFQRSEFPQKPSLSPLTSRQRETLFGRFRYEAAHDLNDKDAIIIKDNWESENIVKIQIPQLIAIKGNSDVRCHKLVAKQMQQLWQAWEDRGLLQYVLTWDGMFYPRFVRGVYGQLSNHSWGTAFDINYEWNRLGQTPAFVGEKGSVRLLVDTAFEYGFYWGGWFSRKDGMHFECFKIID